MMVKRTFVLSLIVHISVLLVIVIFSGLTVKRIKFEKTYKIHLVTPSIPEKPKVQAKEVKKQKKTVKKTQKKTQKKPQKVVKKVKKKKRKIVKKPVKTKSLKERILEKIDDEKPPKKEERVFHEPSTKKTAPLSQDPRVTVNDTQFVFSWYLSTIQDKIKNNWDPPSSALVISRAKTVFISFQIARDGTVTRVRVSKSSGNNDLDNSALDAVRKTSLPPLPGGYRNSALSVSVEFEPLKQ
ncbi:energy transducer TonB [Chlamydiota bacterium]